MRRVIRCIKFHFWGFESYTFMKGDFFKAGKPIELVLGPLKVGQITTHIHHYKFAKLNHFPN